MQGFPPRLQIADNSPSAKIRAYSRLGDVCERDIGLPGQGTSDAAMGPMSRSLRVVVKYSVRFVARIVNGITIDLTSLRAAIRI